jgi:transcriptional regulator with XRE-family HTH domain
VALQILYSLQINEFKRNRKVMLMPPRLGEVIKHARQARRLTLRRLADQVAKEDGTPISPQYLFDIEVHHRVPAPHGLRELARELVLDYDTLLALAGAADVVVREYLQAHPQHTAAVIQLFRAAQEQGFEDWDRLRQIITKGVKAGR